MFKFWGKYKQEKRKIFIAVLGIILTVFAACNSEAGPQTALQGNTPVSYTHLDVYKRQAPRAVTAAVMTIE